MCETTKHECNGNAPYCCKKFGYCHDPCCICYYELEKNGNDDNINKNDTCCICEVSYSECDGKSPTCCKKFGKCDNDECPYYHYLEKNGNNDNSTNN